MAARSCRFACYSSDPNKIGVSIVLNTLSGFHSLFSTLVAFLSFFRIARFAGERLFFAALFVCDQFEKILNELFLIEVKEICVSFISFS